MPTRWHLHPSKSWALGEGARALKLLGARLHPELPLTELLLVLPLVLMLLCVLGCYCC